MMALTGADIHGVILAGGQSSRMGTDKALLPVGEKVLLRIIAEQMLSAGIGGKIIISAGDGQREEVYQQALSGVQAPLEFVRDTYRDCGPLAGLHTALSVIPGQAYGFVMACDMPVLSEPLLARMISSAEAAAFEGEGRSAVIRTTANQPFHALYNTSVVAQLQQLLEQRDLRVMSFLKGLTALQLEPTPQEALAFINLNTPELYALYMAGQRR
ncbi:molybdenum cofactor guanylyltransferase [Paenibacillus sp. OV219]|uniref:molybdenum cofactor guanylyltransferase n=1 Tax=Paenibacillus sp. OV219 TaxID=1884377 RepID=UPI0008B17F8F|nr:molybdenum cofactor guanylyltransferase [Paenibacillus sp. OV219]SEN58353.1 FdhD protein/molybdopterin-guanine dinucleotide biosynthesis protein A [Paenibacillus sp. OV219]